MTDDFPKNRGGWSGPGRTAAYTLAGGADDQLTWGRKKRFGAEARNKGGHLAVKVDQPVAATDGWYSIGTEAGTPVTRASRNARGSFFLRGPAVPSASAIPQLFPRGDGSAFALQSLTSPGFETTVWGTGRAYDLRYYITRDGLNPTTRPILLMTAPLTASEGSFRYIPRNVLPATSGARRDGKYEFAICYPAVDTDGQSVVAVTFDDGTTQRHTIAYSSHNNLIFPTSFEKLGPSTYIGTAGAFIATASGGDPTVPPGYSRSNANGVTFFATTDAGETWFTFPSPAINAYEQGNLADYISTWLVENPLGGTGTYNDCTALTAVQFVPLSRTKAFVWALLGSPEQRTIGESIFMYDHYRIRYGVADLLARTVSLEGTIYDPPVTDANYMTTYDRALYRWERNVVIAPGGGAIIQFNDADYPAAWTANPKVFYTTTGALGPAGTMNAVAGKTGIPVSVSSSKLFMPIYDTEYSLYESSDRGLNWTKRAKISDLASAPTTGSLYQNVGLRSFANVVWLRDNGAPQNATPGAPWLSDDRITPP